MGRTGEIVLINEILFTNPYFVLYLHIPKFSQQTTTTSNRNRARAANNADANELLAAIGGVGKAFLPLHLIVTIDQAQWGCGCYQ